MAPQQKLNIDVTISQELRQLFASRFAPLDDATNAEAPPSVPSIEAREDPQVPEMRQLGEDGERVIEDESIVKSDHDGSFIPLTPAWERIVLRQDGERPIRFMGLSILTFSEGMSLFSDPIEQDVAVYISTEGAVWCAFALRPQQNTGVRPIHHCRKVTADTASMVLKDWAQCVSERCATANLRIDVSPKTRAGTLQELFHSITGHCFQSWQTPPERNQICLQ